MFSSPRHGPVAGHIMCVRKTRRDASHMPHQGSIVGAIVAATLLACCSCSPKDDLEQSQLVLTGSSTVASLASEIGKRFEQEHPRVRVDVQTGGSSRGVADTRRGLSDIGMVSRDLKPDERDLLHFTMASRSNCWRCRGVDLQIRPESSPRIVEFQIEPRGDRV